MRRGYLVLLLGVILILLGIVQSGWSFLFAWLGADFFVLGIAHLLGAHRVFGKRSNGTLPFWSWLLFLPLLLYTAVVWRLMLSLNREPAQNVVRTDLAVGRRLSARELDGEFENYVDLTAEFREPKSIRSRTGYICFPILDGAAPDVEALSHALQQLLPGRTFIHCAQGHGRTGLFALALLLKRGVAKDVQDGLGILKTSRPGIELNSEQLQCVERFLVSQRNEAIV